MSETQTQSNTEPQDKHELQRSEYRVRIAPLPTINIIWSHLTTLYGIYLILSGQVGWRTLIFTWIYGLCSQIGAHAGAHRLWSHRSYKTKLPLTLLLIWWQTISGQNSAYEWARDHRVHHLYSETDSDPHNASRGFFFAHIGWIMVRKHPDVIAKGKRLDLSDLENDPIVMFQYRHYKILAAILAFIGPMLVPWYFWGESFHNGFVMVIVRYVVSLHMTFLVNSWAHLYGVRPYDKNISPAETMVVALLSGGRAGIISTTVTLWHVSGQFVVNLSSPHISYHTVYPSSFIPYIHIYFILPHLISSPHI
ncbi:acyl-CoA desaturase-like [Folsomia candida]|uniref:acyl-CoA desaturase-like n=1 Tax=Folsomia candida TaxID=158441 RepID=UPI0016050CA0|nr:acyl-CoA desaturase-like [Folsomia candida]